MAAVKQVGSWTFQAMNMSGKVVHLVSGSTIRA
jgi:VCBS repeat-containing protein